MNRWISRALAGLVLISCAAGAQTQPGFTREAPRDVRPAIIGVSTTPPVITVNGQPDRLSPGYRIRDRNNMLVMSGAVAGQQLYTVYRRDAAGLVHEVWVLNAEEYAKIGGLNVADPAGLLRFIETLAIIFGARTPGATQ